jgi:8-oxo-dGTP pyrophosphatase MutT (NUDIX family)
MGYLRHIRRCTAHDPADYRPLIVAGEPVGRVRHDIARILAARPDAFAVTADAVGLAAGLDDFDSRSAAVGAAVADLQAQGDLPPPRNETYPAVADWGRPPCFAVDRGAVPALGLIAFGQHVNGVVRTGSGIELWIGRRAEDRMVEPGKLDNLVGGGLPIGLSLEENLLKEAAEEASLPADLARRAVPVGAISYAMARADGLRRDVLFIYDLELPEDFEPRNSDGEVAEFARWPLAEAAARVRDSDDFKFNVALVIIDFLVRHGALRPEEPDYLAILRGLRQ